LALQSPLRFAMMGAHFLLNSALDILRYFLRSMVEGRC
jgi:hypothetical protein